ncbi:hypothetical protein Ac2012v2_007491 [Leucoagaricus gongylophorus]
MPTHQEMSVKVHQQRKPYLASTLEHIPTYSLYRACNAITTPSHCTWKDRPPNKGRWSTNKKSSAASSDAAFHGKYHHRFVHARPTSYSCGESLQIQEHLIKACPAYERHKDVLYDISPDIYLSDILGTGVSSKPRLPGKLSGIHEKRPQPSCHKLIKGRNLGDLTVSGDPEDNKSSMSAGSDAVQVVRDYAGANKETIKIKEIALSIVEATKDKKKLSEIGLFSCAIVAHVINRSHATLAGQEIEMLLRNIKDLMKKCVQRKSILGKIFFWKGKTVQECCQECGSYLARCYQILLLQDNQVLTRQINERLEQTSPMESITPSAFLGPLNEPSGVDAEVVDTAGGTRPRDVDFRDNSIRNVTSNVTDSSLTVLGNGNNITIHVHP